MKKYKKMNYWGRKYKNRKKSEPKCHLRPPNARKRKNMDFLVIFWKTTPIHIFFPNLIFFEWLMTKKLHFIKENGKKVKPPFDSLYPFDSLSHVISSNGYHI
jgi:hypothetical protein